MIFTIAVVLFLSPVDAAVTWYAVRSLCNGRVSVRPSVCPVDSSRLSIHIRRRRESTAVAE